MSMGKRKRVRATELWVPTTDLPVAPSHPFYRRLNEILRAGDFDAFVERTCQKFYAARMGRPSLAPGVYFRLLLLGYFEGLDSERGIAWRAADSLALRDFLGLSRARVVSSTSKPTKRCSCGCSNVSRRRSC
jgi:transposase